VGKKIIVLDEHQSVSFDQVLLNDKSDFLYHAPIAPEIGAINKFLIACCLGRFIAITNAQPLKRFQGLSSHPPLA
jgi:hypothetical protein